MSAPIIAMLAAALAATPPVPPPEHRALAHDMLKELVSINTVHEHGTRAAAEAVLRRLRAAGFSDEDAQLLAIPAHPEQVQVLARLRSPSPKARPVLWLGHLDVVEARREDWSFDPFTLTEQDGWWYGRGTIDMKGEDAAMLDALIRLKQEGFAPDRDLVLALTTDEESGDANGVDWLLKTHRPLIDPEMVINTDAGGGAFRGGKRQLYGVETSEKVYVTFQLETTDKGGHSSVPHPENAIYRLSAGLGRIAAYRFPVRITPTTRAYFASMARLETGQTARDLKAVAGERPDLAAAERLSRSPDRNASLRTTCVATQISGGHAENALPQRARASIQCRMIPSETEDQVRRRLIQVLANAQIRVTSISPATPAPDSGLPPTLMARFTQAVHAEWPGVTVVPTMDFGASDSVFTRAAGLPSFGLASIWGDVDDVRAHGRDERISAQRFNEGVEFTYRLMKAMGRP
jgi:acetylornithine deacetylase/succinyl-diaminopimelate desuccinylase-like protein